MPSRLPVRLLEFLVLRVAPCLLCCDAEGLISERMNSAGSRVPRDIGTTDSLQTCLSKAVREEWLDLVRTCICAQTTLDAVVVLDGIAFDLSMMPAKDSRDRKRVWISMIPLTGRSASGDTLARHALRNHEWGALDVLSRCQLDTLRFITLGLSNQQIAERMHRSKRAVEWHIRHIHRLLGASARDCLARLGRHAGLDSFTDAAWHAVLATRPARRTVEEFTNVDSGRAA